VAEVGDIPDERLLKLAGTTAPAALRFHSCPMTFNGIAKLAGAGAGTMAG
jgi:hypothetical protein